MMARMIWSLLAGLSHLGKSERLMKTPLLVPPLIIVAGTEMSDLNDVFTALLSIPETGSDRHQLARSSPGRNFGLAGTIHEGSWRGDGDLCDDKARGRGPLRRTAETPRRGRLYVDQPDEMQFDSRAPAETKLPSDPVTG